MRNRWRCWREASFFLIFWICRLSFVIIFSVDRWVTKSKNVAFTAKVGNFWTVIELGKKLYRNVWKLICYLKGFDKEKFCLSFFFFFSYAVNDVCKFFLLPWPFLFFFFFTILFGTLIRHFLLFGFFPFISLCISSSYSFLCYPRQCFSVGISHIKDLGKILFESAKWLSLLSFLTSCLLLYEVSKNRLHVKKNIKL